MDKKQLTWFDVKDSASSMFNIMGHKKEIGFAENVWQKLSELELASYSNDFERVKITILFFALADLYRDFCNLVYDKHSKFIYDDLLKQMNVDEFTLGRFYQENIKPKEKKIPDNFQVNDALAELTKYFRKEIFKLLLKVYGSINGLYISLWRSAYPYSDQDNLKDYEILFKDLSPESIKAQHWINNGCYVILEQ